MAAFAALAVVPSHALAGHAFVLGSDYQAGTGTVSVVDLATRAVTRDVATVSSDPVGRWHDGRLYVVNRLGQDNVQVIDPAQGYATVLQFSVGNGSNPQDIAFAGPRRAYVSRLGDAALLRVDPATGTALGTLSLGAFADADGIPEAAHMAVVGDLLFVALGRLTGFVPSDTGMVAVVDLRADTLLDVDPDLPGTQALRLAGTNPWTDFVRIDPAAPGGDTHLWIGSTGHWGTLDGGVEDIVVPADAGSGGRIRAAGWIAAEAVLGGDLMDLLPGVPGRAYAVVSDTLGNTSLVAWDPASGARLGAVFSPGGFAITDAGQDAGGGLWVCDGSFSGPGLYAFAADSLLAGPIATGLPPVGIVFDDSTSAAPPPPRAAALSVAGPWPNPAGDRVRFAVALDRAAAVRIELFDVTGRRVRALYDGLAGPNPIELDLDLSDGADSRLTPGVYVLRARAGSAEASRRIVVVR